MVYALLVFNDIDPKYQSQRQAKETLDAYLEILSNHPEQVNETALIHSQEGGRFRYSDGNLTLLEGQSSSELSLKSIVFLDCQSFNEALELARQFKMVNNSIVELRPAIVINRTTEALSDEGIV